MSSDHDDTHDHRAALLTRAARSIDVAPLDAELLVTTARNRRRRRRATGLAGLAATAVVVGVAALGGTANGPAPEPAREPSTPVASEPDPVPAPPPGWRWVGMNDVVVTVPQDWPVSESPCGTGAPAEVVDGSMAAVMDCFGSGWSRASVFLTPLSRDPQAGRERQRECRDDDGDGFSVSCTGSLRFGEQDLGIDVRTGGMWRGGGTEGVPLTRDEAITLRDRILDSARVLPDGWTTVPFAGGLLVQQRVQLLERQGFEVVLTDPERIGRYELTVSPPVGSLVEEGSLVRLAPPS